MIVYKRKLEIEDIGNLSNDEELIYYRDEEIAFTVIKVKDKYIARKKGICSNEKIEEKVLNNIGEVIEFSR